MKIQIESLKIGNRERETREIVKKNFPFCGNEKEGGRRKVNGDKESKAAVMSHQSPLRKGQGGRFGFSGESWECKFGAQARDLKLEAWI